MPPPIKSVQSSLFRMALGPSPGGVREGNAKEKEEVPSLL